MSTTTSQLSRSINREDSNQVFRLVGFLEYGTALRYLDQLVSISTPQELQAMDELVAERDEFTIYTNLSRQLQRGPSTLAGAVQDQDNFARSGLSWVMALARVEVGSMLAAFTSVERPFAVVSPSPYDIQPYRELLLDGARMHYWALTQDPNLQSVTRMHAARPEVLSYSRRLVLASALLRAAAEAGFGQFSPPQYQEMANWKQNLDSLQAGFVLKVQSYLATPETFSSSRSRVYTNACLALTRGAEREIAAGTASIERFGPSGSQQE